MFGQNKNINIICITPFTNFSICTKEALQLSSRAALIPQSDTVTRIGLNPVCKLTTPPAPLANEWIQDQTRDLVSTKKVNHSPVQELMLPTGKKLVFLPWNIPKGLHVISSSTITKHLAELCGEHLVMVIFLRTCMSTGLRKIYQQALQAEWISLEGIFNNMCLYLILIWPYLLWNVLGELYRGHSFHLLSYLVFVSPPLTFKDAIL